MSAVIARWPFRVLFTALRQLWSIGVPCPSETHFAIAASLAWTSLYNFAFWGRTLDAMWEPTIGGIGFLVSLSLLALGLQTMLLLFMPSRTLTRAAASVLFVVAAAGAYFCNEYGVIMNKDMLRNVLETDSAEVAGLINLEMLASILLLGILEPPPISWTPS